MVQNNHHIQALVADVGPMVDQLLIQMNHRLVLAHYELCLLIEGILMDQMQREFYHFPLVVENWNLLIAVRYQICMCCYEKKL